MDQLYRKDRVEFVLLRQNQARFFLIASTRSKICSREALSCRGIHSELEAGSREWNSQKQPIILHRKDKLTTLITTHVHHVNLLSCVSEPHRMVILSSSISSLPESVEFGSWSQANEDSSVQALRHSMTLRRRTVHPVEAKLNSRPLPLWDSTPVYPWSSRLGTSSLEPV